MHNEERPEEDEFIHALREFGYRVKEIKLKILSDGTREGDWDIGITVDVMKTAPRLDIVVLASGDGDFIPLVEELQENGCRVEVMAFRCNLSAALAEVADEVILLDDQYFHY